MLSILCSTQLAVKVKRKRGRKQGEGGARKKEGEGEGEEEKSVIERGKVQHSSTLKKKSIAWYSLYGANHVTGEG